LPILALVFSLARQGWLLPLRFWRFLWFWRFLRIWRAVVLRWLCWHTLFSLLGLRLIENGG
jgi:hypothetical protein